jgi:hypothetical protein
MDQIGWLGGFALGAVIEINESADASGERPLPPPGLE